MATKAKDIAKILGISTSTVSLVLNNKGGISEETRRKVLDTAAKLGFEKRKSQDQREKTPGIQFVIYKKHGNVVSDTPFFSELSEGISTQARNEGYTPHIIYFYSQHNIEEQLESLNSSDSEGIILLATEMDYSDISIFAAINQPIVLLDSYFDNGAFDCIVINNEQGAYSATKYLMDMGHTDIGYLHSSVEINNFNERLNGYFRAVSSRPQTYNSIKNIVKVSSTIDGAYADMMKYLKSGAPVPRAFFADNDIIATSCVRALKDMGYKIPDDISIVGFDNMPISELTRPALTTIHVPKTRLGVLAVMRLIDVINGRAAEKIKVSVSTELITRDSVLRKADGPA